MAKLSTHLLYVMSVEMRGFNKMLYHIRTCLALRVIIHPKIPILELFQVC